MTKAREHGDDHLDLPYSDALEELDEILAQLESTSIDVDELAEKVARGAELVRYCRQRLQVVRTDVEAVVDDLLDERPDESALEQDTSTSAGR
jgi:exodeoxyribonuclease VII small subunit